MSALTAIIEIPKSQLRERALNIMTTMITIMKLVLIEKVITIILAIMIIIKVLVIIIVIKVMIEVIFYSFKLF